MVDLCVDLQDQMLDMLEEQHPDDDQFSLDLKHIRKAVPPNEGPQAKVDREQAEHRVKLFVLQHGERIGHGDLLTFQKVRRPFICNFIIITLIAISFKVNTARLMRAVSVRAIDRLEYLGLFRLQLFHLVCHSVNDAASQLVLASGNAKSEYLK